MIQRTRLLTVAALGIIAFSVAAVTPGLRCQRTPERLDPQRRAEERRGSIAGIVHDTHARPVSGASIMVSRTVVGPEVRRDIERSAPAAISSPLVFDDRDDVFRYVSTNADGSFEVTGVPEGHYDVAVYQGDQRRPWGDRDHGADPDAPIMTTVSAGRRSSSILVVDACREEIVGRVAGDRGVPAAAVRITASLDGPTASPQGPEAFAVQSTCAGADGTFVLRDLCKASYRVRATSIDGRAAVVARPGDRVDLALGAPASLAAGVRFGTEPTRRGTYALFGPVEREGRFDDPDGKVRMELLDPGSYRLLIESDEGYAVSPVELSPRSEKNLGITLTRWSSLRGRVIGRTGIGVADVAVTFAPDPEDRSALLDVWWPAGDRVRRTTTGADGDFQLGRLPKRSGRLWFGAPGQWLVESANTTDARSLIVDLAAGEDRDLGAITIRRTRPVEP
jgi:hypothetical protein